MTDQPRTHRRLCPRCGGERHVKYRRLSSSPWSIVRCRGCGFSYVPIAPDTDELRANLAWETTASAEAARRQKKMPRTRAAIRAIRRRLSFLRQAESDRLRAILPSGAVLDVGCGKGDRLPDHVIPFGIEISENGWVQANAKMVERGGYTVNAGGLEGLDRFGDQSFDGMVMRSYLEHEDQPRAVLDRAYRKLKPGGVVYVRVPNFGSVNARVLGKRWCGIRLPDHLNYFTLAQLQSMAQEAGFAVRVLNRWNLALDDNIKAVLKKPEAKV